MYENAQPYLKHMEGAQKILGIIIDDYCPCYYSCFHVMKDKIRE